MRISTLSMHRSNNYSTRRCAANPSPLAAGWCSPPRMKQSHLVSAAVCRDGGLASFAFVDATRNETCGRALDAAAEAMHGLDRLNADRARMGKPIATVDLALHLGEVLYGNVGAVDRLDFTVIGPAVNEVARIETLCEPLGHKVLVSAALATAITDRTRLEPLGAHVLRGVREAKEIFALRI